MVTLQASPATGWRNASPNRIVLGTIAAIALSWTLIPAHLHFALPFDVIESGMWGREWLIGSYKHPALPSWCLELARLLSGGNLGWTAYAMAQLFNAVTLFLAFTLGRVLFGSDIGAIATLALVSVEHFSWRSIEFNHNIAMTPFWLATVLLLWLAVERGRLGFWLLLGAVAGLGLYAKLSHALILLVSAAWLLWDPKARRSLTSAGPCMSLACAVVVAIPLFTWLFASRMGALTFVQERGVGFGPLTWPTLLGGLLLVLSPAIIILLLSGAIPTARVDVAPIRPDSRAFSFLVFMCLCPPALSFMAAAFTGMGLRLDWFVPMLALVPLLIVAWRSRRITQAILWRTAAVAAAFVIVEASGYAAVLLLHDRLQPEKALRVNWPQQQIARTLAAEWARTTSRPLKIIAGHDWEAGIVGINNPDTPSILFNGDFSLSPWVTPERVARDGVLVVWSEAHQPTQQMRLLIQSNSIRSIRFSATRSARDNGIVIFFAIVSPSAQTTQHL